jgi:hypothetical protein
MTPATASGNAPLAAHVRLIRAAADFREQAGIGGLSVWADPGEIVIQVPGTSGGTLARTRKVARLAAIAGCEPAPDPHPGRTQGWIHARGTFAGHRVHIYAPVSQEEAP